MQGGTMGWTNISSRGEYKYSEFLNHTETDTGADVRYLYMNNGYCTHLAGALIGFLGPEWDATCIPLQVPPYFLLHQHSVTVS